jgi:hypothetical protein
MQQPLASNRGLNATEGALVALPSALFLSVYLLAYAYSVIASQYGAPSMCPLSAHTAYAVPPRG